MEKEKILFSAAGNNLKAIRGYVFDVLIKAGCDENSSSLLEIGVNEVCQNIIRYGYRDSGKGEIGVCIRSDDEKFTVIITDHAKPFNINEYQAISKETLVEKGIKGKLGITMVRASCDEVIYNVKEGENETILVRYSKES